MDESVLRVLIERARERRDEAAGRAADARRERDAAATTLRTLTDYRDESLARGPVRVGVAVGVAQLGAAVQFDARLVTAIRHQHLQHGERRVVADARDAALLERQRRLKALETLEARRAQQVARDTARREQRALDEYATLLSARRRRPDR